jgi:hypothetical protein
MSRPASLGFPGACCWNITTDGFPGMKMPLPDRRRRIASFAMQNAPVADSMRLFF